MDAINSFRYKLYSYLSKAVFTLNMMAAPPHCWLIVPLAIGCFLVIFSYILLTLQEYEETRDVNPIIAFGIHFGGSYRAFYDLTLVFTHTLISAICCYYLWTNHEEAYASRSSSSELDNYDYDYNASFMINFRKDSWSKLKAIYLYEMELEWNEFNIAAIIFFIHQILTFILLFMNIIHQGSKAMHPRQDVLTAFAFLLEALTVVLLSICLNAEHNPHFFMNRERVHMRGGGVHDAHSHKKKSHEKKAKNVMNNNVIIFMVLIAIICQFFEFLTYPSVNNDFFIEFIKETYNCSDTKVNCSLRAHFVVNELIFRVFVGVTLLNLIFFLLSVLFGEHPHYPSFGGAKSLIRPCWFTAFLIFEIMEIALIQDNNGWDLFIHNIFWCLINLFGILLCVYYTFNNLSKGHRNQWDRLNIATKYEGLLLLVLRSVSLIFVYLDEKEQGHIADDDWSIYRQLIITFTMYFHMITLWLLKKPAFNHDGVQFLLKFITYINAYNLVYSLIFETSHFLELFTDDVAEHEAADLYSMKQFGAAAAAHANQSYFAVSFSTSFAIAHSNLWFLSQFWEWTQKTSNRFKMSSESRQHGRDHMGKDAIALKTPHKQISVIRDEYNTFRHF